MLLPGVTKSDIEKTIAMLKGKLALLIRQPSGNIDGRYAALISDITALQTLLDEIDPPNDRRRSPAKSPAA